MQVRDGMSKVVLTVGPGTRSGTAATPMAERKRGRRRGLDPEQPGPGDHHRARHAQSIGDGQGPRPEKVGDHLSSKLTFAAPDWSLERAAEAMVRGGFRHLVVVDGGEMPASSRCATSCAAGCATARPASCRRTSAPCGDGGLVL